MNKLNEIELQKNILLKNFTSLRVGGPAEFIYEPQSINETISLVSLAKREKINCSIIGAGSNLLISDRGIKGLTICMRKMTSSSLNTSSGLIEALSGEPLPKLSWLAAKKGLKGMEWAIGIPGTVGGAVTMNAGAQGSCIADHLESVKVISFKGGNPFVLKNKELNFAYRKSSLQEEKLIVLSARFYLSTGHEPESLKKITNKNLSERKRSQPYHLPCCGSVFKNPEPLKAWQLIESLGLKGLRVGGAEISDMHANFIVNRENASARDISQIIELVQNEVQKGHGISLHPEVKRFGFSFNP